LNASSEIGVLKSGLVPRRAMLTNPLILTTA
jgi:hypothetical protein